MFSTTLATDLNSEFSIILEFYIFLNGRQIKLLKWSQTAAIRYSLQLKLSIVDLVEAVKAWVSSVFDNVFETYKEVLFQYNMSHSLLV